MTIQIIKSNSDNYWYNDLIGYKFTATKKDEYYEVANDNGIFFVDIDDAIELYK